MLTSMKAIIFDMDGVIFDSEQVYYDACFMAAERNGVEVDHEFVSQFSGLTSPACQLILQNFLNNDIELADKYWYDWGAARREILIEKGLSFKTHFLTLFDYVRQSDLDIALVTSANRQDMQDNFERNDPELLDYFQHVITIEDVECPKPNPEPYLLASSLLGYSPTACIVIEDSPSGVTSALEAGANTIMISGIDEVDDNIQEKLLFKAQSHLDILQFLQENGVSGNNNESE